MLKTASRRRVRRALTLIELLIVITILLALGALIAVNFLGIGDQATKDLQQADLKTLNDTLLTYKATMGGYPSEEEGLAVLWSKESLEEDHPKAARWQKFLEEAPVDRWGNEIVYQRPSQLLDTQDPDSFDLISFGPDGEQDTEDDITNHDRKKNADGEIESASEFSGPGDIGGR